MLISRQRSTRPDGYLDRANIKSGPDDQAVQSAGCQGKAQVICLFQIIDRSNPGKDRCRTIVFVVIDADIIDTQQVSVLALNDLLIVQGAFGRWILANLQREGTSDWAI